MYDLAIIGGGPAGVAAGVYAARKRIKTVFITGSFDSQSTVSDDIQNWIGTVSIKGTDFAKNLENHLRAYADNFVDIKVKELAIDLKKESDGTFTIKTNKSEYRTKTLLVGSGSTRKKLTIKGASEFENKGITYCASCDAPLFDGADVAVIGGGNSAFESAAQLTAYAKNITILSRSDFRADKITIEKVLADKKVKAFNNVELIEIKGDKFVTSIIYKNDGKEIELPVGGIFVEIGASPSLQYVQNGILKFNERGEIIVDPKTQRTSTEGIWAAGDCTDGLYRQNNIAAGDAIKALEDIYMFLKTK